MEESLFNEIVAIRRDIHQHPETAFDVERTAGIAAEEMRKVGIQVRTEVGRTGVVGDLVIPGATKRIALRADMDALPMQEEGTPPYKSTIDGKAHMCGHDSHTAMLIGAAKALSSQKDKLPHHVRFIFQPSEELHPGGAPGMIKDGCLNDVDEIYALHVWPWLETGVVGISNGPAMAQADAFDITIQGKGGHAAAPHDCNDPIVAGSYLVTQLQTLVSRYVSPLDSAVVTVTQFHAGSAYNVIPSEAHLKGTVRTYRPETQKFIRSKMEDLVSPIGALNYTEGYPVLVNEKTCSDKAAQCAKEYHLRYPAEQALFGEDFAYYLHHVPGCFIQLGCRNEDKECIYPLHHPKFNIDEECMKIGVNLLTLLATTSTSSNLG